VTGIAPGGNPPIDLSSQIQELGKSVPPPGQPKTPVTPVTNYGGICHVKCAGGWFEPVQGVYQDDPRFPKVSYEGNGHPRRNPQIEKLSLCSYFAHLPMVKERDSILMGVEKYMYKGEPARAGDHRNIVIIGTGNCSTKVPVRMRFRLYDGPFQQTLYTSPELAKVPLQGPPLPNDSEFQVVLAAPDGIPPKRQAPFKFHSSSYELVADLVGSDGLSTDISVTVKGHAETMQPPRVEFVPIYLDNQTISREDVESFQTFVDDLAQASHMFIPDYYPLPPFGLPTFTRGPVAFSKEDVRTFLIDRLHMSPRYRPDAIMVDTYYPILVTQRLEAEAKLSGADRVVGVLRQIALFGSDYEKLAGGRSVGKTASTKVVFVLAGPDPAHPHGIVDNPESPPETGPLKFEPVTLRPGNSNRGAITSSVVDTVAHELVHTLPKMLWSGDLDRNSNMTNDCGIDYHGIATFDAFGERIDKGSVPFSRRDEDGTYPIMGADTSRETWITQCTYAHLIESMRTRPDPPLLAISAVLSDLSNMPRAVFMPFYLLDGIANVSGGTTKEWLLSVRDKSGRQIAAYPFEPNWYSEKHIARHAVLVDLQIPVMKGAAKIAITFGGKTMTEESLSPSPPSIAVQVPKANAIADTKAVHVSWQASTTNGALPLTTVLYSPNGGKSFSAQLFESPAKQFDVALDPKTKDHLIKLVVTDGTRSSEQTVAFHSK
jgi:hypothetical protein